ncbi:hypothetical protein [Hymenobacter sp. AT01-02]|uniref:hypothetical protein n=1 Tax=Hymenobacter sp. AT01-02 TaxID=1571877 RepID=UPI000A473AAA|nr:hypothetical protein [Hymenobacter sp. AT01-02]
MNDSSKKWKARLLSSSLPLEYEVSKILSRYNFTTSFDFSYSRQEGEAQKEFSIDIHATAFEPFSDPNKINATLTILSECKFREEGKIWAFLPDVNSPDYSDFTLGNTVKCIDSFSMKRLNMSPIYEFESQFEYSSKGTEIGITTGEVFDKDLRHGISQLKYGLPYVLKDNIEFQVYNHIEEATPFFIAPILITNADLYIFDKNLAIETIKDTNSIEDIAAKNSIYHFWRRHRTRFCQPSQTNF